MQSSTGVSREPGRGRVRAAISKPVRRQNSPGSNIYNHDSSRFASRRSIDPLLQTLHFARRQ